MRQGARPKQVTRTSSRTLNTLSRLSEMLHILDPRRHRRERTAAALEWAAETALAVAEQGVRRAGGDVDAASREGLARRAERGAAWAHGTTVQALRLRVAAGETHLIEDASLAPIIAARARQTGQGLTADPSRKRKGRSSRLD
jgi:hypothetical protein